MNYRSKEERMHSTTIETTGDGQLAVSCSCGAELGSVPSRIAADAVALAHVAGSSDAPLTEISAPVAALKAEPFLKAASLINDMPHYATWTYDVLHSVVASAYLLGRQEGFQQCMEIATAPLELDPRDLT